MADRTAGSGERQAKSEFLRVAFAEFGRLWESGDEGRFPEIHARLTELEQRADEFTLEELKRELRGLYKRYKRAKERSDG